MSKFSLTFPANLKDSIKRDSLIDSASAVLTPVLYILIPSLLGLTGWTALMVGGGATWLAGAAFNIPGLRAGAIGAMAVHITYAKFSGELAKWNISPWMLSGGQFDAAALPDTTKPGANGLRGYPQGRQLSGVRGLRGYQPGSSQSNFGGTDAFTSRPMENAGIEGLADEMWGRQNVPNPWQTAVN